MRAAHADNGDEDLVADLATALGLLRKVVREEVARAGAFPARGALAWYASFMLRPLLAPLRALVRGLLLEVRPTFVGERRTHTPVHPPSLRES